MKTIKGTRKEIETELNELICADIDNYAGSTYEDFFFDMFNSDYYIIGTYQAKEWLQKVGAFNAIQIISDYENDVFGEMQFKDFADAEKVVNMVVYSVADTMFNDMLNDLDIERDDEITEESANSIINYIEENK